MVELAKRGTSLNSLWSVVYCLLVLFVHAYITYRGIAKYHRLNHDELWGGETPSELRAFIALIVLAILFLPLFVFTSLLKVGNSANDGTKLGRDHALDCSTNTLGGRIPWLRVRQIWEQFPPFSSVFQLLSAFLILLPEVILTAAEVKYGITPSDAVWSCDLDFLFDEERVTMSNIIGRSNVTVLANLSYYVVPTPHPPVGGWTQETSMHVAFMYLATGLFVFTVRYAAVFWFTNKVFGLIFATLLLFMTIESLFAFCGISVLYKLSVNYELYENNISIILSPGVIIFLYIIGGIIILFSTMIVYCYGANYFHEKFKIIDKRHHPEHYRKQEMIVQGSCQGYKVHTSAMVTFVLLAFLKGLIIYDLVSIYKATKDSMVLSCIIIDVCYMILWVGLWIILTLKQQWQFRILDYVPLNKPIFMISSENLVKSASMELQSRKRPSSLPSELTASESGFGDVNSSEDERERFELSLPPLAEVPGLINSRRKGSTHSLDRRFRGRRNGNQRVTFHETVKRSTSSENFPNQRSRRGDVIYIAADVHGNNRAIMTRPPSRGPRNGDRSVTPIDVEMMKAQRAGNRHSLASTTPTSVSGVTTINNDLNNRKHEDTEINEPSSKVKDTNISDKGAGYGDLTIKNDYAQCSKSNFKALNIQTQTGPPSQNGSRSSYADSGTASSIGLRNLSSPRKESNSLTSNNSAFTRRHLSPTSLDFIDKRHDTGLTRRDSANYSLTSSQETASNDSDQTHQTLCSQV